MRGDSSRVGPFKGLNFRDNHLQIGPDYSYSSMNVVGTVDGAIRKRDPHTLGQQTFTGAGTNDLVTVWPSKTQQKLIVVSAGAVNGKIYSVDPFTPYTVTDRTGALTIGTASPNGYFFVEASSSGGQGPIYGIPTTSGGPAIQGTGAANFATWTASAGSFSGNHMVYFKNRIIMVNDANSTVLASAVGDPRDWDTTLSGASTAWSVDIDPNDGDTFNCVYPVGNYILAFKDHKIYVIYDLDTGANRPISTTLGCQAPKSLVSTPYGVAFIATDGHVYLTNGNKFDRISDIVSTSEAGLVVATGSTFTSIPSFGYGLDANSTNPDPACLYYDNKLYVSTGNYFSGFGMATYIYDFLTKAWWITKPGFNSMCISPFPEVTNWPLFGTVATDFGGTKAPKLWCIFNAHLSSTSGVWQDAGSNYTATFVTAPQSPQGKGQNINLRRRYHALRALIGGSVTVSTSLDEYLFEPGSSGSGTFGSSKVIATGLPYTQARMATMYSLGVSYALSVKFSSTDGLAWMVKPFELRTQPRMD